MKIALAILGIALAAALVVSATMAAGLVDTGSDPREDKGLALPSSGKARILPVGMSPLRIKGTGFAPGEHVRLTATAGSKKVTRTASAGQRGGFVVSLPLGSVDRCNGLTVVAKGDKGSRTSFRFSQLLCALSGPAG